MSSPSIQSEQHVRWNAARKKRNQSRFLIRERIKEESTIAITQLPVGAALGTQSGAGAGVGIGVHVVPSPLPSAYCTSIHYDGKEEHKEEQQQQHQHLLLQQQNDENHLKQFLKAISLGSTSYFSLQIFSKQNITLSKPLPTYLLSTYKIQTLCTSRFGKDVASKVLTYKEECVDICTMFEYALLLGEFGVAQSFIAGGINPCDLLYQYKHHHQNHHQYQQCDDDNDERSRIEYVVAMVMKKLVVDFVPSSLSVYIAKCVYEMRMSSLVNHHSKKPEEVEPAPCQLCSLVTNKWPLLVFPRCNHTFCELCLWESLVSNLNTRIKGDVVRCPVCDGSYCHLEQNQKQQQQLQNDTQVSNVSNTIITNHAEERYQQSLCRFKALPKNTKELKKLPKKSKTKNVLHSSWSDALKPIIGSSQDVRSDKFKRYVDLGTIHHCRACLELGIDVNMTNEYNQTPLYIACWKNHIELVQLLLEWGANANIHANGSLSALNVAIENGHNEVAQLLHQFHNSERESICCLRERVNEHDILSSAETEDDEEETTTGELTKLIQDKNHAGNGAFYIDGLLTESEMIFLDTLVESIPPADATEVKKKKVDKNIPCSLRHYFCDAEGYLCHLISNRIQKNLSNKQENKHLHEHEHEHGHSSNVYVFPHMRILNYDQAGGELLPHIDLTKVDPLSKRRSTHTFILYLRDCDKGGETALLKKLSESGPKAYHEVIDPPVCPRRSRILVFPHACPHQGMKVISTPKILLRGEVLLE
jgi:hypothetical protein